jgi:hypothetical protein
MCEEALLGLGLVYFTSVKELADDVEGVRVSMTGNIKHG